METSMYLIKRQYIGILWGLLVIVTGCIVSTHKPTTSVAMPGADPNFNTYKNNIANYIKTHGAYKHPLAKRYLNLPFEFKADPNAPYQGKFLLIHGMNDSPYVWQDIGKHMAKTGFDVRAILLPGHGTQSMHLQNIHFNDWLKCCNEHYTTWQTDESPIYIGGFSLGGVLATALAIEHNEIAGLLLIAPAYQSKINTLLKWSPVIRQFRTWAYRGENHNPVKYNAASVNSGQQYYALTQYLNKQWHHKSLDIPVLMILTDTDSVIDNHQVRHLFKHKFIGNKASIIYSHKPHIKLNNHEQQVFSAYPKQRILNMSHMGMMISPTNTLYGKQGQQIVYNGKNQRECITSKKDKNRWYGAWGTKSPDKHAVARTTYNPDFENLLHHFDSIFIKRPLNE